MRFFVSRYVFFLGFSSLLGWGAIDCYAERSGASMLDFSLWLAMTEKSVRTTRKGARNGKEKCRTVQQSRHIHLSAPLKSRRASFGISAAALP